MRHFDRIMVESTPALVAAAYAANDQIGGANLLSGVLADTRGTLVLESVVLLDKAKQKSAIDVFFFESVPTLTSADNAPFQLPDAQALKCVGFARILAPDYADTVDSSIACIQVLLPLQCAAKIRDLYYVAVSRGTPTYVSVSDLVFKFGFSKP